VIRAWNFCGTSDPVKLEADQIGEVRDKPDCLLWVDCADPTLSDIEHLAHQLGLSAFTAEDLRTPHQRTKLARFGDYAHVALKDLELIDGEMLQREIDVVFSDGWILTVRHPQGDIRVDVGWEVLDRFTRFRSDSGINEEGMFLWAILDVVVDRYFVATDAIDEFLDDIETVVFDEEPRAIPREIFAMRRALITFRRAAAPLREVMSQILRREVPSVSETAIVHMQDVYDHVLRVLDLIESQRELLTGLLEGQLAVMSNRMNQVMKATSSWGAILIVATLIAGIYGMNFRHMPELEWYYGYPFALGVMALSMYVLYRVFKRRGWL
jgi:magnesium transporter